MRVAFGEYQLDTKTRTLQREGRRIPVPRPHQPPRSLYR
jgi:hypothetical protein